jgi:hypothetical protein
MRQDHNLSQTADSAIKVFLDKHQLTKKSKIIWLSSTGRNQLVAHRPQNMHLVLPLPVWGYYA